jgi:radical SAM superfamily enzyme YgiQ (UPF0313 family)
MTNYDFPPYRPPSEAYSCLIRFTHGCPWNKCEFCRMYKTTKFKIRDLNNILSDIEAAPEIFGKDIETVFIGDSDSLLMKTEHLELLLNKIRDVFPNLRRITSYARIKTLKAKKEENLKKLNKAGLTRVHIGLESGSEKVLEIIKKGSKPKHFIETSPMIRNSNIEFCFYVLLGIGGREYTKEHAIETAKVINASKPDFVRFRTIIPIPKSGIKKMFDSGELTYLTEREIIEEQYNIIKNLEVDTYIANDHISNLVTIEGKLMDNKERFLDTLKEAMEFYSDKKRNYEELIQYL